METTQTNAPPSMPDDHQDKDQMKAPCRVSNERVQRVLDDPNSIWFLLRNLPGVRSWRILSDGLFLLTSFPLGLTWFIVGVVGLTMGFALSVIGVGLVILAVTIGLLVWAAQVERTRLRVFLGVNVTPAIPISDSQGNIAGRTWRYVTNPQMWRDFI